MAVVEKVKQPAETKGVPSDLEALYAAHNRLVFRAAYRLLGNAQDAEDVLQTVFMRLMRREADLPEMHSVAGYLHRAGVNAALDILRARKEQVEFSEQDEAHAPKLSLAYSANRDQKIDQQRWMQEALTRLHPRAAAMFALRYIEEMDNREIASAFDTSQAVVAVTLFRARTQLQKDYKQHMRGTR